MFKKPVKVSAQNQLSGKDRKTMKSKLSNILEGGCVQQLLTNNDKVISCKISGSKMIIYQGNQYPIIVDGTGKSDLFPSVYTMQAYEPIIKYLQINQGVQSYIYNGANLMWPGVREWKQLGDFSKDQVVGIRSAKGQVIGVGAMGCSKKQFESNDDKSGVAIYVLHYKGDKLWETGPKTVVDVLVKGQQKQKQKKQQVKAQQEIVKQETAKQEKKENKQTKKQQIKKQQEQKKQRGNQKKQKSEQSQQQQSSDDNIDLSNLVHTKKQKQPQIKVEKKQKNNVFSDDQDKKGKKKAGKKGGDKKKNKKKQSMEEQDDSQGEAVDKKQQQAPKSAISAKLMDQYLKQCFLNALKISHVEKQLPIDSGRFYIDYMLLARPEGVKLEVKDSTYKKLGKFYDDMAKQKFIQFKHNKDKKGQQGSTITKILYDNDQFKNYEPTIYKLQSKETEQKEQETSNNPNSKKKKLNLSNTLTVTIVYKPTADLLAFMFPRKINYIPTEEEQKQMKQQQDHLKNLPQFYDEDQLKSIIQERINNINEIKTKQKEKLDKDKTIFIDYKDKNSLALAKILKKEIQDFQQNLAAREQEQMDSQDDDEQAVEKGKKKKQKGKKGKTLLKIDRAVLVNKLVKKCSTSHRMFDKQQNIDVFRQGAFKGIQLTAQKANNKNITKIIGLQTFITPKQEADEQLNGFAAWLQQKFACSVNLQNLPGKNAGKEVIVHGNFIIELQQILSTEYQISKDYITTQNKLGKKKKN